MTECKHESVNLVTGNWVGGPAGTRTTREYVCLDCRRTFDQQPEGSEIIKRVSAGNLDYRLDPDRKRSTKEKVSSFTFPFGMAVLVGVTFFGAVTFTLPVILVCVAIALVYSWLSGYGSISDAIRGRRR